MKKLYRRILAGFLILALLQTAVPAGAAAVNNGTIGEVTTSSIPGWPAAPDTISETAVLMDASTGAVLYGKGMDDIRYPASMTKLMTLLVAAEHVKLDDQVTFTETAMRDVAPDSTNIDMKVGETISMEACLNAMIIKSANEVATQIAEYVGGTEANFIDMMNEKAKKLGCKNTHFVNASGMPDDNHYSTAYDFALIMRAGLKNKLFRKIVKSTDYTIPATEFSEQRVLHTHMPLMAKESPLYYKGCIGGKTGLTSAALNNLAVAAKRDGVTYIAVTMRDAELLHNCADSIALFDYGFGNFTRTKVNGGYVTLPNGTGLDAAVIKEKDKGGKQLQLYYYNEHFVGRGTKPLPTPTEAPQITEKPEDKAAETASANETGKKGIEKLSQTARILLGVMGGMFVLLIILIILLVRKERKYTRR